ncbi:MAG TPA: GNAT family N-acetyltransferase [Crocinitomix sp.]|nr:GNAT family N-acetyltransferase [Crocinitomix sp.]
MIKTKNKIIITKIEVEEIKLLRHQILWQHKPTSSQCVIDADFDETTFHIGAKKDKEVVGTSTFIKELNVKINSENQYRLRAMATAETVRGEGIGKQIIEFALQKLKQMKVEILWCDARLKATGFYQKIGFKTLGDIYEVPNVGPHKLMYIEIIKK